jgi:TPR repeat protein
MQLAWAQDALTYVDISMQLEARLAEDRPGRPQTPHVEHVLRTDAMSIVTFLADQHHPKAEFIRGMWYEFGKFGHRLDKKEAYRCYVRAAERGYARAQYRMGMQHENANDPVKAVQHYQRGVAMGDSASNYRVGMMVLLGQHGHQRDYNRGLEHIRFAANTADENAPQGAYVYGMLLAHELENFTVPEHILPLNLSEARLYIEKAAYLGFAKAQAKMGAAYELGQLGCDFNAALSLHYSALAARQGDASAEMTVSKWFLCGYEGVFEKNEELAFEYAQRAARSGLSTAEFAMGYFYEVGICVSANVEEAQRWYKKAKDHGNRDAEGRIDSISRSKTLSKRDHEQVAIQRIKSQYGSQRGNRRPVRQRPPQVDTMPSIPDDRLVMPEPAMPPMPVGRGLPPRAQSAMGAPYPLDDGPPRRLARPGTAADFIAPHVRASSAMALKPQVRPASASIPEAHPVETMPPSVRPVGTGGNYRQQNSSSVGPGLVAPPRRGSRTSQLPAGAGAASGGSETAQNQASPLPRLDIGFIAPPDPTIDQKNRPPTYRLPANKPQPPLPQSEPQPAAYPDAPESPRATIRPPPNQALPQTVRPASVQSMSAPLLTTRQPRPSRPGSSDVPGAAEETRPPGPTTTPKPAAHPAAAAPRPPGKGPKTFDEMGIPMAAKESECVSDSMIPCTGVACRSETQLTCCRRLCNYALLLPTLQYPEARHGNLKSSCFYHYYNSFFLLLLMNIIRSCFTYLGYFCLHTQIGEIFVFDLGLGVDHAILSDFLIL